MLRRSDLSFILLTAFALNGCEKSATDLPVPQVKASEPTNSGLASLLSGCDFAQKSETIIQLRAPCERTFDSVLALPKDSVIVTDGFNLSLKAKRGIRIDGVSTIRSFNSGPHQEQKFPLTTAGAKGFDGARGRDAGSVQIEISGEAKGRLRIFNFGEDGAPGGPGGPGLPGLNGARGQNGADGFLNCRSGGGNGSQGSAGRPGGAGGSGGPGGAGGNITITGSADVSAFALEYDMSAGQSGRGGAGGEGGAGGRGGEGGSGSAFCGGGRAGPPGPSGATGDSGSTPPPSAPGRFVATPAALLQRSTPTRAN